MTRRHLSLFSALVIPAVATFAAPPPEPLAKEDAQKTLIAMGWDRVQVVAIVDGVHQQGVASLSCATAIGLGRRDGHEQNFVQSFFYDRDLGWFYYESDAGRLRLWNRDGYREIKQ